MEQAAVSRRISHPENPRITVSGGRMPLAMAEQGTEFTVLDIRGKDETRRFLESLGFAVGGRVTVVTELGGNLIVNIKGARVALGKSMAARIMVS